MFYIVQLNDSLELHPRHFGSRIAATVEAHLKEKVEGTCSRQYGFIISVTRVHKPLPQGIVRNDGSGFATFHVKYDCVVFRPFIGEVIDCVVTTVSKMGVFAEAGPATFYISNHLLPERFKFDVSQGQTFVSEDGTERITEKTEIRVRIMGVRIDANTINCIGTMTQECLGVFDSTE